MTSVTDKNGDKLSYNGAIGRSFGVWLRGMGLGIPVVSFIANIIAYFNLKKNGETSCDKNQNFVVSHRETGVARMVFAFIIFFVAGFIINSIYVSAIMSVSYF